MVEVEKEDFQYLLIKNKLHVQWGVTNSNQIYNKVVIFKLCSPIHGPHPPRVPKGDINWELVGENLGRTLFYFGAQFVDVLGSVFSWE